MKYEDFFEKKESKGKGSKKKCIIENCNNDSRCRGLCENDYSAYRILRNKGLITEEQALKDNLLAPATKLTWSRFAVQYRKTKIKK